MTTTRNLSKLAQNVSASGVVSIAGGGTGGSTAEEARANIGVLAPVSLGGATATAGGPSAINYKWEQGSNLAEDIGGIWSDKTYFAYAMNKTFTATNSPVTNPASSPAATAFFYANAAGAQGDICASMHVAFARASNTTVFGANIIAGAVGGLTNVKIVGLEIDVEPSAGVVPAAGSGGVYINAFNEPCPGPAIMTGSVGGGTFNNGLVLGGLASTAAGVALESSATANSLINTTVGTFTDTAVLLGNGKSRGIKLTGTAATHSYLYIDSSNNVRAVLGSANWIWRNSSDTVSLVALDPSGNFDLQAGGVLRVSSTQVVGSRKTGWAADTGTDKRTANATYSATAEVAYTQATIQTLMDKVRDLSQTIKALKADLTTHGLIGA